MTRHRLGAHKKLLKVRKCSRPQPTPVGELPEWFQVDESDPKRIETKRRQQERAKELEALTQGLALSTEPFGKLPIGTQFTIVNWGELERVEKAKTTWIPDSTPLYDVDYYPRSPIPVEGDWVIG